MKIKNKDGVSLIEILVVMGLIGILATIAIPAYDNYRNTANQTVLKADAGNGYKAMHAYNSLNNTFCATLDSLGLKSIKESQTYIGSSDGYFLGFGGNATGCTVTDGDHYKDEGNVGGATCKLGSSSFVFGVANVFGGDASGYKIAHDNNSPVAKAGGSCSKSHANCQTRAKCILENKAADCTATGTTAKGTWSPGTLTDVCAN